MVNFSKTDLLRNDQKACKIPITIRWCVDRVLHPTLTTKYAFVENAQSGKKIKLCIRINTGRSGVWIPGNQGGGGRRAFASRNHSELLPQLLSLKTVHRTIFFTLQPSVRPPSQATTKKKREACYASLFFLVPVAGVEPARCHHQWILSPPRLPIPTHRRLQGTLYNMILDLFKGKFDI